MTFLKTKFFHYCYTPIQSILIFREKPVFSSFESSKQLIKFIKSSLTYHDFVQDKLDPRRFLKMGDETLDWCIDFSSAVNYFEKMI